MNKASESALTASQSDWVSLLDSARSNGHRRHVAGLSKFDARFTPLDPVPNGPFAIVEIEVDGRELDDDETAELLNFAEAYFDGKC